MFGGALYLTGVGLLGIGVGAILRRTAGAVAALVALLFILPIVTGFLPSSFQETIAKFLPAQAGMAIFNVVPDPRALPPWAGFAVLLATAPCRLPSVASSSCVATPERTDYASDRLFRLRPTLRRSAPR